MKRILLLGTVVLLLVTGCVNVEFISKDGTKVSYSRFLTNVDRIDASVDNSKVSVGGSMVNVDALTQLLQAIPK